MTRWLWVLLCAALIVALGLFFWPTSNTIAPRVAEAPSPANAPPPPVAQAPAPAPAEAPVVGQAPTTAPAPVVAQTPVAPAAPAPTTVPGPAQTTVPAPVVAETPAAPATPAPTTAPAPAQTTVTAPVIAETPTAPAPPPAPAPATQAPTTGPAPAPLAQTRAPAAASASLAEEPTRQYAPPSIAQLIGAWTFSAADCDRLFQRRGKALAFRQPVDKYAQAAIVDSQQVLMPSSTCQILGASREGDALKLSAECKDSISYTDRTVEIKLKSETELVYNPTGGPQLDTTLKKCPL